MATVATIQPTTQTRTTGRGSVRAGGSAQTGVALAELLVSVTLGTVPEPALGEWVWRNRMG